MIKHCFLIVLVLLVPACTVGPDFEKPSTAVDEANSYIQTPEGESEGSVNRWWERIGDPVLDTYVDQLLDQNLSLKQAGERVIQARERVDIQAGGFLPSVGGDGNASRSFAPSALVPGERTYTTALGADVDISWQTDLFGKIRRGVQSAQAGLDASVYDREALIHSLIATLLNRRVAIATNQRLLYLAQKNAKTRQKTYEVAKQRYSLGVQDTPLSDVYLAEQSIASAQADVHRFERLLTEETYRFDVLLGQMPGTTDPASSKFPPLPPPMDVPVCLPMDLLDRRPDLRASELRIKAANADIGVAVADLYPALSLGGGIGFSGSETRNLFMADQLAGSILSALSIRLFEGGSLRANIRLQESEARELTAGYADDVLQAIREVETALKAEAELEAELETVQRAADALKKAEEISYDRYTRGIIPLRVYLETRQQRYGAEQNVLLKKQERWVNRIALYLALGGDWLGDGSNTDDTSLNKCEVAS